MRSQPGDSRYTCNWGRGTELDARTQVYSFNPVPLRKSDKIWIARAHMGSGFPLQMAREHGWVEVKIGSEQNL